MTDASKPRDGEAAFPAIATSLAGDVYHQEGMTLRDWFAGQAPVLIADACAMCGYADHFEAMNTPSQRQKVFAALAAMRHQYADAMLAERDK